MVEFFQLPQGAGLLIAVFAIGALMVILAIIGSARTAVRISPKTREALLGVGLAFMGVSLGGYFISLYLQAGNDVPAPASTAAAPTATRYPVSPPTLTGLATATPDPATLVGSGAERRPLHAGIESNTVQGNQNNTTAAISPGSLDGSSALQCDPPVYYGIQHCTVAAIQILMIDPKAPRVRFETVLPQGYDREGDFGECRDVSIPQESTGPGCEVDGRYPGELVGDMAERYAGAVAAFNADFFGLTQGPQGLTVKKGRRFDGIYGDHDEREVSRSSLSISRDGEIRIGVVDRNSLPDPSKPWTWRPDPLVYYNSVGGIPLLVHNGDPVNLRKQCTIEASPGWHRCPSWRKQCTTRTRAYSGSCPPLYIQRARTAVGKTERGQLIVVVVPESAGLTLFQLRDTLIGLGAVEAMNLDGGGSSQLWYDGDYLVPSRRPVANGLLVFSQVGQPPAAPSDLSATPLDQTSVHLTWTDNSYNEDGFEVLRDGSRIATVGADVTSYYDHHRIYDTIYSYSIKAYNGFGESETTNPAIAATDVRPRCPKGCCWTGTKF
jgi:hypothetical protein